MRSVIVKLLSCLLVAVFGLAQMSQAIPITGNIGFFGTVTLNTRSVNTATEAIGWNTVVGLDSGTFASSPAVSIGSAVTLAAPWFFNSGVLLNFWSVGGYTFDLTSSSIYFQGAGFLNVKFTGTVRGNGYDATQFTGAFSMQNPAANGVATFTDSMSFASTKQISSNNINSIPDSGMTLFSLGFALAGVGLLRRKLKPA